MTMQRFARVRFTPVFLAITLSVPALLQAAESPRDDSPRYVQGFTPEMGDLRRYGQRNRCGFPVNTVWTFPRELRDHSSRWRMVQQFERLYTTSGRVVGQYENDTVAIYGFVPELGRSPSLREFLTAQKEAECDRPSYCPPAGQGELEPCDVTSTIILGPMGYQSIQTYLNMGGSHAFSCSANTLDNPYALQIDPNGYPTGVQFAGQDGWTVFPIEIYPDPLNPGLGTIVPASFPFYCVPP